MEKPVYLHRLARDYRVAIRWHFHFGCPISEPRSVLGFSLKNRDRCFLSKNQKMRSYDEKRRFW